MFNRHVFRFELMGHFHKLPVNFCINSVYSFQNLNFLQIWNEIQTLFHTLCYYTCLLYRRHILAFIIIVH
jgi:hypothetical protein